jgi:hypothetical protein
MDLEFLKSTICKVREEVAKIMQQTNYGNITHKQRE